MGKNPIGIKSREGVTTERLADGSIKSTGPTIEAMIEEWRRDKAECARKNHPHPSEILEGSGPKITYYRCTHCGAQYQRPTTEIQRQAIRDAKNYRP